MQGKVTMQPLVCNYCGRERLTLARSPWGQNVVICKSCKQMTTTASADDAVMTVAEAAALGLPKVRGRPDSDGQDATATDSAPGDSPVADTLYPEARQEPAPSRGRRKTSHE